MYGGTAVSPATRTSNATGVGPSRCPHWTRLHPHPQVAAGVGQGVRVDVADVDPQGKMPA